LSCGGKGFMRTGACVILTLILMACLCGAQSNPQTGLAAGNQAVEPTLVAFNDTDKSSEESAFTIRKRVDEVSLVFTVLDRNGRPVANLLRDDIGLLDDNRPPDAVTKFQTVTDMPLRVGILIDASGSVNSRFAFEQESAVRFLQHSIRPASDKAFLLRFHGDIEVVQDFTNNTEQLARAVRSLSSGGGSAVYDAVHHACREKLLPSDGGTSNVHRAIVLISDGEDNQSRHGREEALELAMRSGVTIYTISTNTSGLVTRGDKTLSRFAEMTGGRAFFPSNVSDLTNAFSSIERELRSQYFLAYRPADFQADGRYRRIGVAVLRNKGYRVRNRQGYYAPRD